MSAKRKEIPKQRKTISLEKKIEILDKLKSGRSSTSVAKDYGMNEATVRSIKRREDSVRKSVAGGTSASAKFSTYKRHDLIEAVEKALVIWLEDQSKRKISVDSNLIRHKALDIFSALKEKQETPSTIEFSASKGWFERFKKRHNLNNIKLKGEIVPGDEQLAKEYFQKLRNIVQENSYVPDQVFNADETGLFWKKPAPKSTYLSKSEKSSGGFKAAKDRVTLLLCSNASGDCVLKPLLINKSQKPRATKGKDMKNLSVHWRSNEKASMTCIIFENWFYNCFVPEAKRYLEEKNLNFRVLLLLDSSPSHPMNLQHPNVQIEFLPPNMKSLIQPQDQGMISTFKAFYIRRTFADILRKLDESPSLTLPEVWKNFTISNLITNVTSAVAEIKKSTFNSCWKVIWPEVKIERNVTSTENVYANIIDIAHSIGGEEFDDFHIADIEDLFEDEEISVVNLVDLVYQVPKDTGDISSNNNNNAAEKIDGNVIAEGLRLGKELQTYFLNNDPDIERALTFQTMLNNALSEYEEIYKNTCKHKQTLITDLIPPKNKSPIINNSDSNVPPSLPKKRRNISF